jgi:hypothetical protein
VPNPTDYRLLLPLSHLPARPLGFSFVHLSIAMALPKVNEYLNQDFD